MKRSQRFGWPRMLRLCAALYLSVVAVAVGVKVARAQCVSFRGPPYGYSLGYSCDITEDCPYPEWICQTEVCAPAQGSNCSGYGGDAFCIYPAFCGMGYTECTYQSC
jgi:hypothetical protein